MPKLKKTLRAHSNALSISNKKWINNTLGPYESKKSHRSWRFKPSFEEEEKILFVGEGLTLVRIFIIHFLKRKFFVFNGIIRDIASS